MFDRQTDRGQAYTLESLAAVIIIITALLFSLQSVIITPTTSSGVDPDVRSELRQQADDILVITASNDTYDLSFYARFWNQNSRTFAGKNATSPRVGYGDEQPPLAFGEMLHETFTDRSRKYNIELYYQGKNLSDGRGSVTMVDRGTPSEGAITTSYVVTLYDNQTLTAPRAGNSELWEYGTNATNNRDGYYPVPNAVDGPVYNVVEVRLTVW
jgi:hypothetical protein